MTEKVLLAGQCDYDFPRVAKLLEDCGAVVERASTLNEFNKKVHEGPYKLVLLNRLFDADRTPSLELIKGLKEKSFATPLMLVSDYPEAQAEAVQNGGVMGFGKAALKAPETKELLKQYLS